MKRNPVASVVLDPGRESLVSSSGGLLLRQTIGLSGVERVLSAMLATLLGRARLGNEHPACRQRPITAVPQVVGHLIKQSGTPYSSTMAKVVLSIPAAPLFRRTLTHARHKTSLR